MAGALLQSCNATRYLPEDAYLLRANKVKLKAPREVKEKASLSENLASLIAQKPNKRFLGIPIQLYLYNLRHQKYEEDTANYQLQSGTVEKPVLFDSSLVRRSVQNMRAYLFNAGFFYAKVRDTVTLKNRRAYVTYRVETGPVYRIDSVSLDIDDSLVRDFILYDSAATSLRRGTIFNMQLLETERERVTANMRNLGYYHFTNENVSFEVDTFFRRASLLRDSVQLSDAQIDSITAARDGRLAVRVVVRRGADPTAYRRYRVGRIRVYPDFRDRTDFRNSALLEKRIDDVLLRYHDYWLKEEVIYRNIFLDSGSLFSQSNYDQTITQLNELGVFQYVRIALQEDTTAGEQPVLNCNIFMNPALRYDFNTNFEVSSASTYTAGTAVSFGIRNRNVFKSANQLSITATTGIELIYDERREDDFFRKFFTQSRNLGLNTSLTVPRFLVPFRLENLSKNSLPRTVFSLGSNLLDRANYFTLTNTVASLAYRWRQTETQSWEFSPLFVSVFRLPSISEDFQKRLDTNTFLANSYRNVTIVGENLAFTFNNNELKRGRNYTYLRLSVEEAGGLLYGVSALSGELRNRMLSNAASYVRLDADLRHYLSWGRKLVATRLATGVGLPYGNNTSLPYAKQYFGGGAYSVRGWRVRTLGPGSYYAPDTGRTSSYLIDRTGDIRLEASAELRFDLFRLFSGGVKFAGAAFVDAGNVWLARENPSYPGGEFRFSQLYQDIAMSTGAGLRLNFGDFIILRVDGAVPVKKPYLPNGGWVFNDIRLSDPSWRAENLVLSFAIGYPF